MSKDAGDFDLLIRTGGEHRISNFMLWQMSYAEIIFVDTLWPDLTEDQIMNIIHSYENIERRFGSSFSKKYDKLI